MPRAVEQPLLQIGHAEMAGEHRHEQPDAVLLRQHETLFENDRGRRRVVTAELQPAAAIGGSNAIVRAVGFFRDRGGLALELLGGVELTHDGVGEAFHHAAKEECVSRRRAERRTRFRPHEMAQKGLGQADAAQPDDGLPTPGLINGRLRSDQENRRYRLSRASGMREDRNKIAYRHLLSNRAGGLAFEERARSDS
jgi:hypothetical protein